MNSMHSNPTYYYEKVKINLELDLNRTRFLNFEIVCVYVCFLKKSKFVCIIQGYQIWIWVFFSQINQTNWHFQSEYLIPILHCNFTCFLFFIFTRNPNDCCVLLIHIHIPFLFLFYIQFEKQKMTNYLSFRYLIYLVLKA